MANNKKFYIVVVADHNDSDCNTSFTNITEDDIHRIMPLITAIKQFKPYSTIVDNIKFTHTHNWPEGEYGLREDLGERPVEQLYAGVVDEETLEYFSNLVPKNEGNVHTIVDIHIVEAINVSKLL